jgi:UDP-3-O-[3-hydroxymyristoyl] glucosamine N-acyltransferase
VVGRGSSVGAGAVLHPHVVLYPGVELGERAVVHAGSVLGADGFGYATERGAHLKIPQVGGVEIGADVEIGALSAVDRATLDATVIGAGTKIDNLVQVGHNVRVGRNSILCGQVGIAGSAELGDGVVLGGQAGVAGHLALGDGAQVASKSAVYEGVAAGEVVAGIPAVPIGRWRRRQALAARLEEIWRRLRALERGRAAGGTGEEDGG